MIVIVEVPLTPGVAMLTVVLVSAKLGGGGESGGGAGAVTITATIAVLVLATTAPLEPTAFTNSMYSPGVVPGCVWILKVMVAGAFPEISHRWDGRAGRHIVCVTRSAAQREARRRDN
jgi:hypothetical protein